MPASRHVSTVCPSVTKGRVAPVTALYLTIQPNVSTPMCRVWLRRLLHDLRGQDLIEYALMAAMVGLGAVAAMPNLALDIANTYGQVSSTLGGSVPQSTPASAPPSSGGHGEGGDHHR